MITVSSRLELIVDVSLAVLEEGTGSYISPGDLSILHLMKYISQQY